MDQISTHTQLTQKILDEKFKKGKVENLYIPEVLSGISEINTFKGKVDALKNNSERSLNTILYYAFCKDRSRVTKEIIDSIEYTPASADDDYSVSPSSLYNEAKRLYIFYRQDLSENKIKLLLTELFETLHPDEAEVLKGMFLGKLPYKGITKKLVGTSFPDLFADEGETIKTEEEE